MHAKLRHYRLGSRLVSFRSIDLGVPHHHEDEAETARRFRGTGRWAVEGVSAEIIIHGCTASAGFDRELQAELGGPVIDSAIAAVKRAEHLALLCDRFDWSHSKAGGYESLAHAERKSWLLRDSYEPIDSTDLWVDLAVVPAGIPAD